MGEGEGERGRRMLLVTVRDIGVSGADDSCLAFL